MNAQKKGGRNPLSPGQTSIGLSLNAWHDYSKVYRYNFIILKNSDDSEHPVSHSNA